MYLDYTLKANKLLLGKKEKALKILEKVPLYQSKIKPIKESQKVIYELACFSSHPTLNCH
jgi:hypothetical protein